MSIRKTGLIAAVVVLASSLSACMMDENSAERADYRLPEPTAPAKPAASSAPVQKTYASKEPTQKATPGPKRAAAPQIPVFNN